MKKITAIFVMMVTILTLAACNKAEEIEVNIANEIITETEIQVDVILTQKFDSIKQIEEIAYNIASQIYEKHFDTIGSSSYTLILNLYHSEASLSSEDITYGSLIFDINKKIESPGLSLYKNLGPLK